MLICRGEGHVTRGSPSSGQAGAGRAGGHAGQARPCYARAHLGAGLLHALLDGDGDTLQQLLKFQFLLLDTP